MERYTAINQKMAPMVIFQTTSPFQKIEIVQHPLFGKTLLLDGDVQISESDADVYNKNLIGPLAQNISRDSNVLILGGGSGGCISEILAYSPKRVLFVDIDNQVVEASKKYLPSIHKNSFFHKSVRYIQDEALNFLNNNKDKKDAIIYSLTSSPEKYLLLDKQEFLEALVSQCKKSLTQEGFLVFQCCAEEDHCTLELTKKVLKKYFETVNFRSKYIPSYGTAWVFADARNF